MEHRVLRPCLAGWERCARPPALVRPAVDFSDPDSDPAPHPAGLGVWEFKPIFFSTGLVLGLLAGFIEEIGWTGFATPRLLKKNSAVVVGLFLGVMHALYHLAADFLGNSGTFGGYWVYNFLGFSAFVIALRILIVWVYANTESLFLAQLMHASSTGFLAVLVSTEIAPVNWVVFYISYAIVLGLVAIVVLLGYGTDLVRGKQVRINEAAA